MTRAVACFGTAVATAVLAIGSPGLAAPAPKTSTQAAAPADLQAIQKQLDEMRSQYEARISALEARLKTAEDAAAARGANAPAEITATNAATAPAADTAPAVPAGTAMADNTPPPEPVSVSSPANAMNPGISVVLNGNYVAMSHDPALAHVPGFPLSDDARLPRRGFSLGESEITLASNVDPFFAANLTASIGGDNQLSIEEAYINTTALPGGLTFKAGRFFSGIGYLNERHSHNWSFIDMPLPYRALLGTQYGDDGVQLRWLVPAPIFLEVGGELYSGAHFPGGNNVKNGAGAETAFVHTGNDISNSASWLAALSYIHTQAHDRDTQGDVFNGSDGLAIASGVFKWAPGGNPVQKNVILSAEYFRGRQDGTFNGVPVRQDQSGWYAQGVYQFTQGWSAGLRYAALDAGGAPLALHGSAIDGFGRTPRAISGLLEYDTSEFGRFRAEYTHDMADRNPNDELLFQYTVVYGPHGAHRY